MSRSFTSSSERWQALRSRPRAWAALRPARSPEQHSLAVIFVGVAGVLLIFEGVARLLAQELPPPQNWYSREVQAQVARIDQLADDGGACLAFVGTSTVGSAVDPDVLTAQLGHDRWYIAWLSAGNTRVLEPWTEEIVVPKLDPQYVVLGVTSMEVNDEYEAESVLESYYKSPGRREAIGEENLGDRAIKALAEVSAFVELRQYLRSPGELVARLTGRIPNMAPRHGESDHARNKSYGQEPEGMARVRGYVDEYSVGEDGLAALEATIDDLQAQGRSVALVQLPVLESEWASWHEHGMADIRAYRAALADLGARQSVPVFSYPGQLQDRRLYRDPIHLNGEGSALFTEALGADLRAWMRTEGGGTGCQ